ncbi:HipA family kinase [Bradyrhizobium sp. F1.13.3]|uniref:HipA family kinase n=1 Tax=Bradyrhizobium sp. F1.13.3 TaxID=3156351 RepID=UPI0033919433
MSQHQLFPKRVSARLAPVGTGITAPWWIRADDGLCYIIKDDAPPSAPSVRACEYLWSAVARSVGLPAPTPEVIEDVTGRLLFGSRREQSSIGKDHATCLLHLLGGQVHEAGKHLSRIYAFDLFCGNWDRHPGNYLIINETSALVVFAIDFSHAPMHPGCAIPGFDPLILFNSATRVWFKTVVAPYGPDVASATETVDRLAKLPVAEIEAILTSIPLDWLSPADRDGIIVWWRDGGCKARADLLLKGLKDGTYI